MKQPKNEKKFKKLVNIFPQHTPPAPESSLMQLIPAECRYLGLFVMVEVYHSLRLCCAALHELMMNERTDRQKERESIERIAL